MTDRTEFVIALVGYLTGKIPQAIALGGEGTSWDWVRHHCTGIDEVTLGKLNDILCVLDQHPLIHLGRTR